MLTVRRSLIALLTGTVLLIAAPATPAGAAGRTCASAPGTSAIDQYCESIPGADGNVATGGGAADPDRVARDALPPSTYRKLAGGTSETSKGLLGVVGRTATPKHGDDGAGTATQVERSVADPPPSADPLSAVSSAVSDGPTLGVMLPIALLVIALGAVAIALVGRGGRRDS